MKPVLLSAVVLSVALCASSASAAIRTFPSAAPCNITLQACINAADPGDTILVAANGGINQSLSLNKPLTLRAAAGYRPGLAAGFSIGGNVNAPGNWRLHVEGFTLARGFIQLTASGGDSARIVIRDNRIESTTETGAAPIGVSVGGGVATTLDYDISYNHVDYDWSEHDGSIRNALQVIASGAGGDLTGLIRDNRIEATGVEAYGIYVGNYDRNHRVAVSGNHVLSGVKDGIYLRQGSLSSVSTGTLTALVASNVLRSKQVGARFGSGIQVEALSGTIGADVLHNTVVDAGHGVRFHAWTDGDVSGRIEGNLLAYLDSSAVWLTGVDGDTIGRNHNLVFEVGNPISSHSWPASTVSDDPRLRGAPGDANLLPDSPAIDQVPAANLLAALDAFGVPHTDGNGLNRVKWLDGVPFPGDLLDIGALEAGDASFVRQAPDSGLGSVMALDIEQIDGVSAAAPQVTHNMRPGGGVGVFNNHPLSLSYVPETAQWYLRHEDLAGIPANAAFNIFVPARGGRFTVTNTVGNVNGNLHELDDGLLNNVEDAILLAVRNPGGGTVHDFTSPLGVMYFSGVWSLVAMDGNPMPLSGGFHIYTQPPSLHAFVHRATMGNIAFNSTRVDHPSLNGHRCAVLHVTQSADGAANVRQIGVYYIDGHWRIFNQDGVGMSSGTNFHVVIDAQSLDCPPLVFADGFE